MKKIGTRTLVVFAIVSILACLSIATVSANDPGDVTGDGRVNVLDLILVGQSWQLTGEPGWVAADMNTDGWVNILDLIMVCQHWTG